MNVHNIRPTGMLAGVELIGGVVVVYLLDGGRLISNTTPLLWTALVLSGCAGLLARRAGGSGLLAGALVTGIGVAALTVVGWATRQAPLPGNRFGQEALAGLATLIGGSLVGWAGGATWAARRQPHLWT